MSPENSSRSWQRHPGPLYAEVLPCERSGAPPLVLLHGFTQTRRSWDPVLDRLESAGPLSCPVIRIDLPGHGGSSDIGVDLWTTADLVARTGGHGTYVGYSMGGRVALHTALAHPYLVSSLVTIGATPGIADEHERRRRRDSDDLLADDIERLGVAPFIQQWLDQPLFSGLPHSDDDLDDRCSNTASGLATSLRMSGTGTQDSLWPRLTELEMPILLMVGDRDEKFSAIAQEMATAIGTNASVRRVHNAGHSAHLEQPAEVALWLADFLRLNG